MKKIITIILSALLAMSCMPVTAEETQNSDKFVRYNAVLKSVGIDTGFTNESNVLSREKLAELALKLMKTEKEKCTAAKYTDVPLKHYAADLVYTVTKHGYMTGFDDNTFRLSQNAAPYELARVALYMLDYGPVAENSGWTNADFNQRIVNSGLLKGVTSSELTEGNAAAVLYNMLKEPVVIVESITQKGADFKTSANKTYITEKCNLLKCRGIIRADGETTAVGVEKTGKGKVNIGGEIYYYDGNLKNSIGYTAEYYATDIISEDIQTVIYLELKEPSEELIIEAEDIQSFSNGKLKYESGDKIKTETVNTNKIEIFLNGGNAEKVTNDLFMPKSGSVKLVDFDGDGRFDSAFVTSLVYMKVAQVNKEDYAIVDSDMKYEVKSDEDAFVCEAGIDGLANGSIISIAPSGFDYKNINGEKIALPRANAKRLEVSLVDNAVSGTVKGFTDDSVILTDGEKTDEYEYSSWFKQLVRAGVYQEPDTESEVTLYIENGRVVYAIVNSVYGGANKKYTYGYVVKTSDGTNSLENPQFKIWTEDGVMEVFETADNFKLDGVKSATFDKIQKNTNLYKGGTLVKQLVCFDLNADEKLKTMYTATNFAQKQIKDVDGATTIDNPNYSTTYKGYNEDCFSLDYGSEEGEKLNYRNGFLHRYTLNENTKVFVIPNDSDDEKYFSMRTKSYFVNDSKYEVKMYDVQKNFIPSAVVCMVKSGAGQVEIPLELYGGNSSSVVMKMGEAIDDEGNVRPQITLMENVYMFKPGASSGVKKELFPADDDMTSYNGTRYTGGLYEGVKFKDLQPGDVIMFKTNDLGEMSGFRILTRYNDIYDENGDFKCREINTTEPTSSMYITCGKVIDIFEDYTFTFNIDPNESISGLRYCSSGLKAENLAVQLFDPNKSSKAIGCTLEELRIGDYVVTRSESGGVKEVFIFRK